MKKYASDLKPGDMFMHDTQRVRVLEVANHSYGTVAIYTDARSKPFVLRTDQEVDVG